MMFCSIIFIEFVMLGAEEQTSIKIWISVGIGTNLLLHFLGARERFLVLLKLSCQWWLGSPWLRAEKGPYLRLKQSKLFSHAHNNHIKEVAYQGRTKWPTD